ncbi:MAG: ribonuclease HII [Spirochaetaceae bacterium]|nr:MAG: ribonuclease HII [Spirochaetaceae bacterium]
MPEIVCGIDEAGRGPLAGPVTAAAVILPPDFPKEILDDSKKLSPKQREKAEVIILSKAVAVGVGWAWPMEIDRINIHNATLLAMKRALLCLGATPDMVYVDGKFVPCTCFPCEAVIKGDTFIPEIQAASIIAKTARDRFMTRYARIEPQYSFEKHKGYPSKLHRELVMKYGPSGIHRMTFRMG